MTENKTTKNLSPSRKINIVEGCIFLAVACIFANSLHQLVNERGTFQAKVFTPMQMSLQNVNRGLASSSDQNESKAIIDTIEINCGELPGISTTRETIKLEGNICKAPSIELGQNRQIASANAWLDLPQVDSLKLINVTNQFQATVLADSASKRFKTDLIPLQSGINQFQIEFKYKTGKIFTKEFSIQKN